MKTTPTRTEGVCAELAVARGSAPITAFGGESKAGRGTGKLQSTRRGGFGWACRRPEAGEAGGRSLDAVHPL